MTWPHVRAIIPLGRHRHAVITYEQSRSVVQLVTAAAMVTSTDIITSSRGIGIVRAWKLELFPAELCNWKNQNLNWRLRIYHRRVRGCGLRRLGVGGCGCVNGPWHPHSGTAMHTCMLATCAALSLIAVGVAGGHQSHALGADIQDLGKKTTQRRRAHGPSVGFLSEGLSGGDSRVGHERWRRASTTLEPTTGSGELDRLSHLSTVADTFTQLDLNQCLVCMMTLSSAHMHTIGRRSSCSLKLQHAFCVCKFAVEAELVNCTLNQQSAMSDLRNAELMLHKLRALYDMY
jgi:hypothetical protein